MEGSQTQGSLSGSPQTNLGCDRVTRGQCSQEMDHGMCEAAAPTAAPLNLSLPLACAALGTLMGARGGDRLPVVTPMPPLGPGD